MAELGLAGLPDEVVVLVLRRCGGRAVAAVAQTCRRLHRLATDAHLWRHLCIRDYTIKEEDLTEIQSYHYLYTKCLKKYGWMFGLYQSQINLYSELMEVRFRGGMLEAVNWLPTSDNEVTAPLKEYVLFSIRGDEQDQITCLPGISPHQCSLVLEEEKGEFRQLCSDPDKHVKAVWDHTYSPQRKGLQVLFLNEVIGNLLHKPIILPNPREIPQELWMRDGNIPTQIFTPGLFKGTYGDHGIEIILFKYKDEHEIHGIKVTGDANVCAGKISVKVCLKFPAVVSEEEQRSFEALERLEAISSSAPVTAQAPQPFLLPEGCTTRGSTRPPSHSIARYHGFGQIAYQLFHNPRFIPVHVMVFSNDLLGVLWLQLRTFSIFHRVERKFTSKFKTDVESVI